MTLIILVFGIGLAEKVVHRPLLYFLFILIFLLMLGYPFLSAQFGVSDFRILPEHSEHRRFYDTYSQKFNEKDLNSIQLLIQTQHSEYFHVITLQNYMS